MKRSQPQLVFASNLVHGPEPLKCTNSRDQPRVVRIWSLFEGDSKKLWYQSEIGSSFVFLKHWNITKGPFCMKTRLKFKSSIECIVRRGSFIYEIKLQERSVFYSFFLCYIWIFYKNGNIRSNSLRACTRNASWVNFKMATATKAGACLFFTILLSFRMILILSIKSKNIFKTYSHSRGEWSLIIRYTALSLKAFSNYPSGL